MINKRHREDLRYEETFEPSLTVPNEALTVRELLKRHQNGTLGNVGHEYYYDESDDIDLDSPVLDRVIDFTQFDEIYDYQQQILKKIKNDNKKETQTTVQADTQSVSSDLPNHSAGESLA